MQRFSVARRFARLFATGALCAEAVAGCGASAVGGPDPARATYFKLTQVDGGGLPFKFLLNPMDLGFTYLVDARLVALDLGRTTDTRIFDDRGGTGSGSGNGRDTTVSTGRMADVRVFSASPTGVPAQTDSNIVEVIRIGDVLYITRTFPQDLTRSVTDTALYTSGVLVRPLGYWRSLFERPTGKMLVYTTVR